MKENRVSAVIILPPQELSTNSELAPALAANAMMASTGTPSYLVTVDLDSQSAHLAQCLRREAQTQARHTAGCRYSIK